MSNLPQKYAATAFVSCSLREEDRAFISFVEQILHRHNIKPVGTVGKHSIAPENPIVSMRKNIPNADFVVICATPRYLQMDIHNGSKSLALPEMVHVETGMAFMANKPVIVFVQDGTNVGSFIPNLTQYITIDGTFNDFLRKKNQIHSLLNNACRGVQRLKDNKTLKTLGLVVLTGFAIYGVIQLVKKSR